ncbi:kinase-like domain-containing protein [Haematococcus lacustris]
MPGSLVVCVADMAGPWAGATQAVVAGTGLTAGQAESSQILHVLYEEQSIMQLGSTPSSRPASPSPTTPSTVTDTDTCHAVPDQATVLAQLQLPSPGLTLASPAAVSLTASLGSSSPSSLSEPLSLQSDSLPSTGAAELGFEGGSLARVVDVLQPAHGITGSGYGPHLANSTQGTAAVGESCPGSITDSQSKADASRDSAPLPGAQEQGTIETPTGSARSVPQGAASSSQQPPAMTAAEVVDIMADASCEPAPGLPPPTLPSSPTPSPPTPSTPHAASADHAAGEQSLPPGAYQAHVFQQAPGELQAAQAHAAMLQQVQDSFHVRRSTEVDSDGLRLGLEPDPASEFAKDLPSDVDGAFADGGSDGQSVRLSDEASAAALFSDGGSDDGFNDVDSGSEDGEVLSVSAYAIEPAVKLSIKPADVPARRAVPPSDNDIIESNGMRLLGTKYEVQHMVGEGAYGKVMKCRVRGSSPEQWVAVKEFKIEDDDPDADDVKRTSRREVNLLRSLEHPNIVAFIDEFMVRDRLFIVMEFVPCNLLELLEAQPGGMDREAVRLILFQLCTAIAFIHAQHIVYRDVKPENLLINEQGHLKLCDFGFARHISPSGEDKLTDYVATRWYRAPELLLGPPYEDVHGTVQSKYGPAIDMWAIGCLMGELMDGEPLFAGDSDLDQLYRIQTVLGPVTPSQQALFNSNPHNAGIVFNFKEPLTLAARYEDRMTEVELDFLSRLLTLDPSQRITGQACLQHPYLADLGQQPLQAGQLSSRRSSSAMSGASSTTTSL